MMNLQLQLRPQTERRLRKMLQQIPDQEVFVQNMLAYQIAELQKGILNMRIDLQQFEAKYHLSTETFYEQFTDEKSCGDSEDFLLWAGVYEMLQNNEARLRELVSSE